MTISYAVTFEFETRAPLTHRGTVEAGQPHVQMARAVRQAKKALQPREWTSVVCVLDKCGFKQPAEPVEAPAVTAA